ncbi:putative Peptide N-acetyl-beta-D-glucosaminyl asparaginase amidase A-domain-containing protein [Seiridium unicorne]|uniref:Peptide N-acetyl-beta-D-glucosaminyl asparaginase amidase A-domain-containing protein n=1 Tax=Seiridium unicorne TaxID=138068 RepID=A0ABR2V7Q7_9PEZI
MTKYHQGLDNNEVGFLGLYFDPCSSWLVPLPTRRLLWASSIKMLSTVIFLLLVAGAQALDQVRSGRNIPQRQFHSAYTNETADGLLEVIQPYVPPRKSLENPACRQIIVEHVFENSYGVPFVGGYSPPGNCTFTTTILNLSVTSDGRQYDRLALLYLGDNEIWRTSTAMPIRSGIHWSYQKDVSIFHSLFSVEQKLIFSLDNVIQGDLYTGAYNITIEALYFNDVYSAGFTPAEKIYPISKLASAENTTSVFSLPDDSGNVNLTLPRNIKQAVVSVIASGNGAEEFWFTNVPNDYTNTFPSPLGTLSGYGQFREVQLLIDGQLAGVEWPFPILFSGGVDPGAWRPIVGIDTYDLPTFEIDITPWLSILCDGQQHEFQLKVVSFDDYAEDKIGTVGSNWYVAGSIFVWLDETVDQTKAGAITISTPAPDFEYLPVLGTTISDNGTVTNASFWFSLAAGRRLSISSTLETTYGNVTVSWDQNISFLSIQNLTNEALNQSTSMITQGNYSGSVSNIVSNYQYPLNLYSSYDVSADGAVTNPGSVFCMVDRSLLADGILLLPFMSGLIVGEEIHATRQNVTSMYYWNDTIVEGTGDNNTCDGAAWLSFSGAPGTEAGVTEFAQYLQERDDAWVDNKSGWNTIAVPSTEPLPYVEGKPEL